MSLEELRNERLKKLKRLRDAGVDPYPPGTRRTHAIGDALAAFDALSEQRTTVTLAGRVMAQRGHGGLTFLDLNDGSGTIQALIGADRIGQGPYDFFLSVIDVADFVEVTGTLLTTKRGERSIQTNAWGMLAKSVRPLPEKWHGLQDVEERYRQRALDLLFNPTVKDRFTRRFRIISSVRRFFEENGYHEVETPILQLIPGGATARPFKTHLNTLDLDLYLRVAPELYLKRLLVGGFERVFEIGRNFRNEGMDREHNPEFTMLEAYAAYQDHAWLMDLTEQLLVRLVTETFGSATFTYQGKTIHVRRPFRRLLFSDLVREASGLDYDRATLEELATRARQLGVTVEKTMTKAVLGDEIYKKTLRANMMDPVFVVGHPKELSPLAKQINPGDDAVARFQLIMGGFELTNGFSELNDPVDQLERMERQQELREKGNEEAQRIDIDYVQALEHGMPPAAGIGIGLDRLVALLTDSHSLRDILLFPTMKPRNND
ncbi:MAG TPA: lysine--tRNA ligase [Candidatus Paceibacterota bacterium]|nr:lysine--tRNA ligase [Candidatus Paceibacterota bacterium]